MPGSVRLQPGDLAKLDFEDDTFELVVCFEVIEHFVDPFTVLDELVRVLAPGGVLLISSPNRDVYQPGNPHHLHEFTPTELEAELAARLGHVKLFRQQDYIVSAVLSDATAGRETAPPSRTLRCISWPQARREKRSTRSRWRATAAFPRCPSWRRSTGTLELREWLSAFEKQTRAIADKDNYIDELTARVEERDRLARAAGRRRGAPGRRARAQPADRRPRIRARGRAQAAADARREAKELDQMLMYGRRMLRFVRPLIKPLRKGRRKLRGAAIRARR